MLQKAVPVYLNVLNISRESDEFFVYTNILDQVLVFQRCITDVTPRTMDMVKVLSGVKSEVAGFSRTPGLKPLEKEEDLQLQAKKSGLIDGARGQPLDLSKLGQMPNTYKAKILQKAKEMGAPIDALQDFDVEADVSPAELDPVATAEGDEAGENMVNNLLDESQEDDGGQSKAKERMKQIDEECREEARRDEKLLK